MYEESVNEYHFDQFVESNSLPGMMDDLEVIREETPEELKRDNRAFYTTGIISILAGLGLVVGMNADKLGLGGLIPSGDIIPWVLFGGVAALGFGLIKGFRKIFRRGNLNLPALQIRRKTLPNQPPEIRRRRNQQTAPPILQETFRPNRKLRKSLKNRVFLGVAGGLAEHSGISATLIRLLFIAGFAISGGAAAVIYLALGLFLPNGQKNLAE